MKRTSCNGFLGHATKYGVPSETTKPVIPYQQRYYYYIVARLLPSFEIILDLCHNKSVKTFNSLAFHCRRKIHLELSDRRQLTLKFKVLKYILTNSLDIHLKHFEEFFCDSTNRMFGFQN